MSMFQSIFSHFVAKLLIIINVIYIDACFSGLSNQSAVFSYMSESN